MKSILFVKDKSCNIQYLEDMLNYLYNNKLINLKIINLSNYTKEIQYDYDIIIYQTFPDESHKTKFNKELIYNKDKIFLKSDFIHRILFDSHDSGSKNGFIRFDDFNFPIIKNTPSYNYLKSKNIILTTTFPIKKINYNLNIFNNRNIQFSYKVNYNNYPTSHRIDIKNILLKNKYNKVIDMDYDININYNNHLYNTLISICPEGWGEGCFRHLQSLNNGCLLLSYESINNIKLLPNINLIENIDYISFNLNNINDKIQYLLDNKNMINTIRYNGYIKFITGYSIEINSINFLKYIDMLNI